MITFYTLPKGFSGHIGVIQRNAIESWKRVPGAEVILFGEEEGLAEAAQEMGVRHEPDVDRNEHNTPMVSDAFAKARELASNPLLAYVNTDIIFTDRLLEAAASLNESSLSSWLMVGQRYDIDIKTLLPFGNGWQEELVSDVNARGSLHGKAGIDFFLFPRSFPIELPPMAVGRPGWDSWLIYETRARGIPLVDATGAVLTVHQNHPPAYKPNSVEGKQNKRSAGGYLRMGTLRDADWTLSSESGKSPQLRRNRVGQLMFSAPVRGMLAMKRAFTDRFIYR